MFPETTLKNPVGIAPNVIGVRPSPGAATWRGLKTLELLCRLVRACVAVPEDGHTPAFSCVQREFSYMLNFVARVHPHAGWQQFPLPVINPQHHVRDFRVTRIVRDPQRGAAAT